MVHSLTGADKGEVDSLTDAHAGVAEQQEDIGGEIVAAEQLLLNSLVLLDGKRTRQALWSTRDILTAEKIGEFR